MESVLSSSPTSLRFAAFRPSETVKNTPQVALVIHVSPDFLCRQAARICALRAGTSPDSEGKCLEKFAGGRRSAVASSHCDAVRAPASIYVRPFELLFPYRCIDVVGKRDDRPSRRSSHAGGRGAIRSDNLR